MVVVLVGGMGGMGEGREGEEWEGREAPGLCPSHRWSVSTASVEDGLRPSVQRNGSTCLWLAGMAMRAMATMVTVAAVLAGVGMTDMVDNRGKLNRVGTMDTMEVVDSVRMRRSSREGGKMADKVNLDSELVRLQQAIGQCQKMRNAIDECAIHKDANCIIKCVGGFLTMMMIERGRWGKLAGVGIEGQICGYWGRGGNKITSKSA